MNERKNERNSGKRTNERCGESKQRAKRVYLYGDFEQKAAIAVAIAAIKKTINEPTNKFSKERSSDMAAISNGRQEPGSDFEHGGDFEWEVAISKGRRTNEANAVFRTSQF